MLGAAVAVSDYAHHPDEMEAALEALAGLTAGGRIGVVFQPHLYSRTAAMAEDMGRALSTAAWSLVLPVFGARELPIPGVDAEQVAAAARRAGADCVSCRPEELAGLLRSRSADAVVFMGAGTIDGMARALVGEEASWRSGPGRPS